MLSSSEPGIPVVPITPHSSFCSQSGDYLYVFSRMGVLDLDQCVGCVCLSERGRIAKNVRSLFQLAENPV